MLGIQVAPPPLAPRPHNPCMATTTPADSVETTSTTTTPVSSSTISTNTSSLLVTGSVCSDNPNHNIPGGGGDDTDLYSSPASISTVEGLVYVRHSTPKDKAGLNSSWVCLEGRGQGVGVVGSQVSPVSVAGEVVRLGNSSSSGRCSREVNTTGGIQAHQLWMHGTGTPDDLEYHLADGKTQGSDPFMQTARGKLQSQRSKLNEQINMELRLRAGAENLYKATTNKRSREAVARELSYFNSNLQLLKEELADLNSSVHIYQAQSAINSVPMLPLGLKETKEVDFKHTFKNYIHSHYHEDPESYESEIQALSDIRQACRTPARNEDGVQLLYEYYNHLYFIEKRFFPSDQSLGLYFEWYDSLTGVPRAQRTVGFEKGSTLFNIAALYTQIGARQDRATVDSVHKAANWFQRAAGAFQYLHGNFSHAPSMDLQPRTLTMLIQLMLSQAQEAMLEYAMLDETPCSTHTYLQAAQEAAKVAEMYAMCDGVMRESPINEYVPPSWVSMVGVKAQYFTSIAHHHTANAIIDLKDVEVQDLRQHFEKIHIGINGTPPHRMPTAIETCCERKTLGKAHLRQSILCLEDAMALHNDSKELRQIDTFQVRLRAAHDESLAQFAALEEEDDFSELMEAPPIRPHSVYNVTATIPDFAKYKVDDLMQRLGPLAIFSARHSWTAPHELILRRDIGQDYGFSVRGDSPVIIAMVEDTSLASKSGMKIGDFMVAVSDRDVKWGKHDEVVQLIRTAGLTLQLHIVTPLDRNYIDTKANVALRGSQHIAEPEQEMDIKQKCSKDNAEKTVSSWTLRRKGESKEKQSRALTNRDR